MSFAHRSAFGTILLFLTTASVYGQAPTRAEIAQIGKVATALVEVGNNKQGSAFCIHPAGFFVTNEHVVRQNTLLTLVINTGQKTEKVLHARVVRTDPDLDLALLQVNDQKDLPALALGTDTGLTELSEVVAFGYPFGTGLAINKKEKPAISINVGSVTSLRQRDGELHRIQLDAVLNPGNSGGPVLDKDGKVVGVVVSGLPGAGVNFAIPVSHLSKFLARPEIVFEPPSFRLEQVHQPMKFHARAFSLLPSNTKPFDLDLHLFVEEKKSRKFKMEFKDGIHSVQAEPIPKPAGPAVLRVTIVFDQGTVSGRVSDRIVQVAGKDVKLGDVRRLAGIKNRVILHDGTMVSGEVKNLGAVAVNLGSANITLDLTKAKEVRFERPGGLTGLGCTVVAFQDGKEVGRQTHPLSIQGLPQQGEETVELEIEPPVLAKDKEIRELPAAIQDVAIAGGGRYVILHLPGISKLAVFDVNEAKVVRMLPAPEDNLKFAGGLDKLVVALPIAKKVQRWDLNTFELEATAPLALNGQILSLSMGSASKGPIVVPYREANLPWVKYFHLTLDKLERREAILQGSLHPPTGQPHFRSAADGQAMGIWSSEVSPSGVAWIKWEGQVGKATYDHSSRGHVVPGADGKILFTGTGMFTGLAMFPNQQVFYPGSDRQAPYLPALHGQYYMQLGQSTQAKPFKLEPDLTIYKHGLGLPIVKRLDIDLPSAFVAANMKQDFTFDKRVLLIPLAKLLIIIPTSNDRLVLHRLDLEAALQKAGGPAALQVIPSIKAAVGTEIVLKNGFARVEGDLAAADPKDSVMAASHRKIYLAKLEAGKTYQIDHQSKAFDAYLRLEDAQGTQLAADDDSGGNLDARIVFQCPAAATYRIIATSLAGRTGEFVLTIQQK
jgi:hypothetical protein